MEIHYADKGYRRRSIWALLGVLTLLAVLLWQLNAWLQGLASQLSGADPDAARRWLRALLAALGLALSAPAAALGVSLHRLGRASRLQGRFPPREFKTLRDVRVLRDAPALRWARRVETSGTAALLLAGALASWALWALWYFR
jgi:multisubunit Na+/H+ antiporter MnhG subunit